MQVFATDILLLLLLFVTSSSQQCNTPILRDKIQGSALETDFLGSLGSNRVLPLLNQSEAVELKFNGFTSPVFNLGPTEFYITALDIQFGSVTGQCVENGIAIDMMSIRIGDINNFGFENIPVRVGYARDNILNLTELGDPNGGRIIRLRINDRAGKYIQYPIRTTDPPGDDTDVVTLCLRTEFYGCTEDPLTFFIFLQYNLIEPTVYTDSIYTGVTSMGYMSGGEGLLNDGSIGTSPMTDSTQWLGWSNPDLDNPEVLFLFSSDIVTIQNISVFYWGETSSDISIEISSDEGIETALNEITQNDGSVYRRIYVMQQFGTGLLKLNFIGASTVLLTEIQIGVTGSNNLLGPSLDTSNFTDTIASTTTEGITQTITNPNSLTTEVTTQTADALNTTANVIIIIVLAICLLVSVIINIVVGIAMCVYCCYKRRGMPNDNIGHKDTRDDVVIQSIQYEYVDIHPGPQPDYIDMQPVNIPEYEDMKPGERGYQSLGIEEGIEHVNNNQGEGYYEVN